MNDWTRDRAIIDAAHARAMCDAALCSDRDRRQSMSVVIDLVSAFQTYITSHVEQAERIAELEREVDGE